MISDLFDLFRLILWPRYGLLWWVFHVYWKECVSSLFGVMFCKCLCHVAHTLTVSFVLSVTENSPLLTLHYNCGFIFLPIFVSFILKLLLGICTFVIFVSLTLTFYIVFKCCSSLVMLLVLESVLSQVYIIALTLLFSSCIFFRPFPLSIWDHI